MNGMLRDLLSERADTAGSPDLDLHDLIARGERGIRRRRRVAVAGTAAAVALTVGASFALVRAGDRAAPPVGPPTTNPPSTVEVLPDTTGGSRPLTYGSGRDHPLRRPHHRGRRGCRRALRVRRGAGHPHGRRRPHTMRTACSSPTVANRKRSHVGSAMLTAGDIGSLLVWQDGDDVVIYDIHVRGSGRPGAAERHAPRQSDHPARGRGVLDGVRRRHGHQAERWQTGSLRRVDRNPDSRDAGGLPGRDADDPTEARRGLSRVIRPG